MVHELEVSGVDIAYYLDPQTAQHLLDILYTIQIGYGAVLLSFLGAIHWGLEFAGMGGHLVLSVLDDLTIGIPSILFGNFSPYVSLAYYSSSYQFCSDYTIPWIYRDVLCRLRIYPSRMG